jgi:hypothetical protein
MVDVVCTVPTYLDPSAFTSVPPFCAKFTAAAYLVLDFSCAVRSLELMFGCGTLNGFAKFPALNMDMPRAWVYIRVYII